MTRNFKKNTGEKRKKKARKTGKKRRPNSDRKRGKTPMVAGNPGSPGRRISTKTAVFPILFAFRDVWLLWFSQIPIFESWYPSIFISITDPPSKSLDHHQTLRNCQLVDQESTLFARSIEKSTRQMLSAHWCQLMSEIASPSDFKQHADPSMIIIRRIPKDAAWPATLQGTWWPINVVNRPVYDNLLRLLTH